MTWVFHPLGVAGTLAQYHCNPHTLFFSEMEGVIIVEVCSNKSDFLVHFHHV